MDGDRTNGGYDYGQLQQLGLRFNVLQLSRFIPLALDTMQLTVDSLVFYIDDTLGNGTCIDCSTFASGNGYSTLLKINAGTADVSKFLTGTSVADNEYRYAFTSFLNGSTLSGTRDASMDAPIHKMVPAPVAAARWLALSIGPRIGGDAPCGW